MEYGGLVERLWPYDATPLERIAHRAGMDADELREWLRAEVTKRLRKLAETEPVEFPCPRCDEPVEVSSSYFEKVRAGGVPPPLCFECKRPKQVAQAEADAARFVDDLGEQAREQLAAAVAALR